MINREKLLEWIERFNQGELEGGELKEFLALMEKNPRLRAEVRMDKELNEYLAEKDILELRDVLLKIKKEKNDSNSCDPSIYFLAASFFLLVGMLFSFFFHDGSSCLKNKKDAIIDHFRSGKTDTAVWQIQNPEVLIKTGKGGKPGGKTNLPSGTGLLAERFLPDPAFESLVGMTTRDGIFVMESPESSKSFSPYERILFQWIERPEEEISLTIMDNEGTSKIKVDQILGDTISVSARCLEPGLFYYKILRNDEIVYFGKFIIK